MLTQLQLEGPELEPLLARVRNEFGTSARIVHAEKIRSGGVAGFFAQERFELTVEVDTSAPRVPAAAAQPPVLPPVPAAATSAPAVHLDLARDRALDLDAAARTAGREAPFAAIAGLQRGTTPEETSLFGSLAALSALSA
ncbi:MAG: hypothetical protein M3P96_16440, partial [Actinomycetota bacterium]|nr:hypothetical protein [Actinomycetota bacterium]